MRPCAKLFELAGLVVANRGELDQTAFRRLLAQPANRIFRPAIRFFGLSAAASALNDLSATTVRHALASGRSIDAPRARRNACLTCTKRVPISLPSYGPEKP